MNWVSTLRTRLSLALPAGSLRARLAGGAFWSLLGSVAGQLVTALGSIVVARILKKTVFGEFGTIRGTVLMFSAVAAMGVGITANKYIAELRNSDLRRAGQVMSLAMIVATLSGTVVMALVIVFADLLATDTLNAPHLTFAIQLCAPALLLTAIGGVHTGILIGLEAFRPLSIWSACSAILLTVGIVLGAWKWGLMGALWGMLLMTVLATAAAQLLVNRVCRSAGLHWDWRNAWSQRGVLGSFALPSMLAGIMVVPVTWLASAIIARRPGGFAEIGVFNAANQWRTLILFVPQAVGQVVLPLLTSLNAAGHGGRYLKTLRFNMALNFIVGLLMAAPLALLSPWIMGYYGDDFRAHWPVLVVLVASAIFMAVNNVIGQALTSLGRMWWSFTLNLLWGTELLAFTWLLAPHGAMGLAWAWLLSYLFHTLQVGAFTALVLRRRLVGEPAETPVQIAS